MTAPTAEAIHTAWWDLCQRGRPVTVRALAAELGVSESLLRTRLGCLNYLSLISNTDENAPGATT